MPAREKRRRRGRLPAVLFWTGVILAPLAGLLVWFAHGGGPLRAAAVLAILGTVLIGLSVVLGRDTDGVRLELQENLLAEAEALRAELREALTVAVQQSNQSLRAEVADLQHQLDRLAGGRRAEVIRTGQPIPRRPQPAAEAATRYEPPRRSRTHRHRAED